MEKHPLLQALNDWAVPDKKIVGKLEKGGAQLDFVGHADVTRILIEVDPMWTWEPCDWNNGRPAIHVHKATIRRGGSTVEVDMATMWGRLTVHGITRVAVGSCELNKPDLDKELVSDFLRNAAMRFGICLSLWTKQEWEDLTKPEAPKLVAKSDYDKFVKACTDKGIDPDDLLKEVGKASTELTEADFNKLRSLFKTAVAKPATAPEPAPILEVPEAGIPGTITKTQLRDISLLMGKKELSREHVISIASFTANREITDIAQLNNDEALLLIDTLKRDVESPKQDK
jgi:hypothetical protein